jgi:biopolymer transport protein ExbB
MKKSESKSKKVNVGFSAWVIPVALVIAILVFNYIFGDPKNFIGNDRHNAALPGNFFGTIFKGGFIVPVIMTMLLSAVTFVVERFIAITRASGKGSVTTFINTVKAALAKNDLDAAAAACDKQKGSVANVIRSVIARYRTLEKDTTMARDQKLAALEKEVEESTSLELPTLEQNLIFLATFTSLGTLMGLLGTVLGMIRAFAALANAGAPDSVALAGGISEALVNTAFGIATAATCLIFYNFFTSKIDKITYTIDEAGYSLVQSYAANHA